MTAFVDTNVLIRHLTGQPPDQAQRATRRLEQADQLLLPDVIVAEVVYVMQSFYGADRARIAESISSILSFPSISVVDEAILERTVEVYAHERVDFADAYLPI